MNKLSILVLGTLCISLAACGDKPVTTCKGDTNIGMPEERMSEMDRYFIMTDFSKYVGSNVARLESELAYKYRDRSASTTPGGEMTGLTYTFHNNYTIRLSFAKVEYTTYNSASKRWNFSRLGKETITGINVSHTGAGDFYYCKDYGEIRL